VEQTATLRMIPRMSVWRPCDAVETAVAWKLAVERKGGPTSLILSRQGLPHMERSDAQLADIEKGGYVLKDCDGTPDCIIIATGSEVELAMNAAEKLAGKKVRVVSMPSTDAFDAQDADYKEAVLPAACTARVAVEAGVTGFWNKYVGLNGKVIGIDTFGESAPAADVFKHFNITAEAVVDTVNSLI
jgi:transketolase